MDNMESKEGNQLQSRAKSLIDVCQSMIPFRTANSAIHQYDWTSSRRRTYNVQKIGGEMRLKCCLGSHMRLLCTPPRRGHALDFLSFLWRDGTPFLLIGSRKRSQLGWKACELSRRMVPQEAHAQERSRASSQFFALIPQDEIHAFCSHSPGCVLFQKFCNC